MAGKGLIISIDYTDEYCQACYYSQRHQQPESISAGTDIMRYLIPSALCYDAKEKEWGIGNYAVRMAEKEGVTLFTNLLQNVKNNRTALVDHTEYSYIQLFALYFRKLLEFIQIRTSIMAVENITVTMKQVDRETKEAFEQVFQILQIPSSKVRLLSSAESFGYYIISEERELWERGALLFDFSGEGFFVKQLRINASRTGTLLYVNEFDFSDAFSVKDLASEILRQQLDQKLRDLYLDFLQNSDYSSVYFTGEGFDEQWFTGTLTAISGTRRAFKGNNIYVKGACMAGYLRSIDEAGEFPIICAGRTRTGISIESWNRGKLSEILLSPAAEAWYDAGYQGDFILEEERSLTFLITSLISGRRSAFRIDLEGFPQRPSKASRIHVEIQFFHETECEITVRDKGFGDLFPGSGASVSRHLNLQDYI